MVQIIQNPAYSSIDTSGQDIGRALQGIAGAFTPRAADINGQLALFKAKQELAARGTIGDAIAKSADAQQDYTQDAPLFSTPQPPPTIDVNDPSGLGQAFMTLGQKPGQALQAVSALAGGPNAPGVITGAIPDNAVKETPQYLDQAANKPENVSPGSKLISPVTGAVVAENPKEEADKTTKFQIIGEDEFGHKQYGYPPEKGATPTALPETEDTPAQTTAKVAALPGVETVANDKTPDLVLPPDQLARLNAVPTSLQGTVASILQGRTTMPKLTGRMSPFTAQLAKAVFDVNPQFDAVNNQTQVATRKAYAPGGNNNAPGTLIQNGDAALDHLAELKDASDKLQNLGSVAGPALGMAAGVTGGAVGHDYSAGRAALDTKAQIASAEAIKYLAGATGGGEGERNTLMAQFSSSNPPDSRLAAIQGLAQDILQKKQELQAGWHRSMGANAPDFEVTSLNSIKSIAKLGLGNWTLNGPAAPSQGAVSTARQGSTPATTEPATGTAPQGTVPHVRIYNPATGALE